MGENKIIKIKTKEDVKKLIEYLEQTDKILYYIDYGTTYIKAKKLQNKYEFEYLSTGATIINQDELSQAPQILIFSLLKISNIIWRTRIDINESGVFKNGRLKIPKRRFSLHNFIQ